MTERVSPTEVAALRDRITELETALAQMAQAGREGDRQRREFEAIFQHSPTATVIVTEDGTVTAWNAGAERLFGYRDDEAVGRNIDDLVTTEDQRREAARYSAAAASRLVHVVTRRVRRDGQLVDVELRALPVLVDGQHVGSVAIYHDITALQSARRAAEEANESKSRFLSSVSHELRTPLTSVLGFAKIIGQRLDEVILPAVDTTDPKRERAVRQVRDNLGIIVAEGERLTSMINNVLDLAKIEAGRFDWKDEELSIAQLVEHATNATASLFVGKGVEMKTEVEQDLPLVRGDPDQLLQVVINLLSNAIKFTDRGRVVVSAARHDGEIRVSVSDTGVGIAPEDHDRVFEQFRQVGDTLTDKPHGTGLGLPISKEIVQHHGGRMWVDSAPGRGSTFRFSLPINGPESERANQRGTSRDAGRRRPG